MYPVTIPAHYSNITVGPNIVIPSDGDVHHLCLFEGLFRGGGFRLLGVQCLAIVVISGWTVVTSYFTLKLLDLTIGLRVPLHEEMLGADIVEHSINGSYDKATGEWHTAEGQLVMVVDRSNQERYQESIRQLKYHLREDNPENVWVRKRSFMGFSRGPQVATSLWENGRMEVDKNSDKSSGFASNEHTTNIATISVSNGILHDPHTVPDVIRPNSSESNDLEVLVVPNSTMPPTNDVWPDDIIRNLRRKNRRNKRFNSR